MRSGSPIQHSQPAASIAARRASVRVTARTACPSATSSRASAIPRQPPPTISALTPRESRTRSRAIGRCDCGYNRIAYVRSRSKGAPMNLALLVLHVVVGVLFFAHGAQKLFGWFGGYGIGGTAGFFDQIGLQPGRLHAWAAALAETV